MKFVSFSLLALLLLAVEAVLTKSFGLEITRLNATIALVVYLGVRSTTMEGVLTAYAIGYVLDVFTGRPTDLYPFLAVLIFLVARVASLAIDGRSRLGFTLFVAAGAALEAVLAMLLTTLTSVTVGHSFSLAGLPLQVLFASAVGALTYPLLRKMEPGERPDTGALKA